MAKIERFEELQSWQKARQLTNLIEVQSELYLALDRNYINQDELTAAYNLATETKRLINGMIGYLRKS